MHTAEMTLPTVGPDITSPFAEPEMRPDEMNGGLVMGDEGVYHLILLPGEAAGVTWQQAKVFAAVVGGQLPSLQEMAIMVQNVRAEFPGEGVFWLGDGYDSRHAFYYHIGERGSCDFESIDAGLRVRVIRRVYVQQRQRDGAHGGK